jgi:hypothetical protein
MTFALPRTRASLLSRLIATVACGFFAGCTAMPLHPDANRLATTGQATFDTAASFYSTMTVAVDGMLEEELLGTALDAAASKCIKEPANELCAKTAGRIRTQSVTARDLRLKWITALEARRSLAAAISGLYASYATLADANFATTISAQGSSLVEAINGVKANALPAGSSDAVGQLLAPVATALQDRNLAAGEAGLEQIATAFNAFFAAELPAWKSVAAQWDESLSQNITYLLQLGFASAPEASATILQDRGLQPGTRDLLSNPVTAASATGIVLLHATSMTAAASAAAATTSNALKSLQSAHQTFPAQLSDIDATLAFVAQTQSYLDLVAQWRATHRKPAAAAP